MSGPIRPPLTVETIDGNTVGRPITKIKVSNGTLTVSGNTATITTGGGGGTGTVTSVNPKADSGTGTAITTTGSFELKGGTGISTAINAANEITITASNNGTVTSISTTAPLAGGTITSAGTISIAEADATTDGYLNSTDWATFNNKQNTLSLTTTGTSGASTLVGSTLNIPQYSGGGGGTITGSITDTQVAFGDTTVDSIQGSANLTFDGNNLSLTGYVKSGVGVTASPAYTFTAADDVGMYLTGTSVLHFTAGNSDLLNLQHDGTATNVRIGNGTGEAFLSSKSATNLTLQTNDGTNSGVIVIEDGVDGQISLTPNGNGKLKLDGVELDNSAIATGYVLKATSATEANWQAESGGGGTFSGSLADTQLAFGNTTADSIQGSAKLTFDDAGTAATLTIGEAATNYPRLALRGNNGFIYFQDTSSNINAQIGSLNAAGGIVFKTEVSGTERLQIKGDGSWGLGGANYGTSGQVITSAGTGSPPTWTTVGGGGSGFEQINTKDNINASYTRHLVSRMPPWGSYSTGTGTTGSVDAPHCRPFISPISGDVTELGVNVTTADSTAVSKLSIGIYSDSDGAPDSLIGLAIMNSTSTGSSFQTSFSTTATLVQGTQYWYMWVRNNNTNSIGFSAVSNGSLVWVGSSSTVSAGMNQQSVLTLSGSDNALPGTVTQTNLSPTFYSCIELGLKIA